jgi:DNA transformation protein
MVKKDTDHWDDLFQFFGPIATRRMFGGAGIFAEGLMIGLVTSDGRLHLKTDAATREDYLVEKSAPFSFRKGGRTIATAYYTVPERLLDDPEEFAAWAKRAQAVALAAQSKKPRGKRV